MLLHVKAVGDGRQPRYGANGSAPPGVYAGRGRAPDFAPLPDGELVADCAETRRAIAVGDLALLGEHADGYELPAPAARESIVLESPRQNLVSTEAIATGGTSGSRADERLFPAPDGAIGEVR